MQISKADCDNNTRKMTEKIDKLKDNLTSFEINVTKKIAELPGELEAKFDQRYANKRIEKGFDKLIYLVIAGVIIGILNLIFK